MCCPRCTVGRSGGPHVHFLQRGVVGGPSELALFEDRPTSKTIVACAIDNLGKGAAGQAVQNANLALGLEETAGLRLTGVLV